MPAASWVTSCDCEVLHWSSAPAPVKPVPDEATNARRVSNVVPKVSAYTNSGAVSVKR